MQAAGPDRAPLALLITASHLSHCLGQLEAKEVLGIISRVILSEADSSPMIRQSVPPPLSPFSALLPLEIL